MSGKKVKNHSLVSVSSPVGEKKLETYPGEVVGVGEAGRYSVKNLHTGKVMDVAPAWINVIRS